MGEKGGSNGGVANRGCWRESKVLKFYLYFLPLPNVTEQIKLWLTFYNVTIYIEDFIYP